MINIKKILKRSRREIAVMSTANPPVLLLKANVKEAVNSLYAAKQRTLLALVGIIIGIGSVIAMISVGEIVKNEALAQFQELGTDILTIRNAGSATSERHAPASIRLADALALPAKTESISAVAPSTSGFGDFVYAGKRVGNGMILGVTAPFSDLNKLLVSAGRFISDLDFRRYYCVIGQEIAQAMRRAGTRRLVGEKIRLDGLPYVIVGVPQDTPGWGMRQLNTNRSVFVPVSNSLCTFDDAGIAQPLASSSGSVRLTDGLTPPPPCGRSSRAQQGLHKQFTCKPCLYRPRGSIQCIITSGNRRLQLISKIDSTPPLIIVVL
jgi:putative ABC transport system permease protein